MVSTQSTSEVAPDVAVASGVAPNASITFSVPVGQAVLELRVSR